MNKQCITYGSTELPNPPCDDCKYYFGDLLDMQGHCHNETKPCSEKNNYENFRKTIFEIECVDEL